MNATTATMYAPPPRVDHEHYKAKIARLTQAITQAKDAVAATDAKIKELTTKLMEDLSLSETDEKQYLADRNTAKHILEVNVLDIKQHEVILSAIHSEWQSEIAKEQLTISENKKALAELRLERDANEVSITTWKQKIANSKNDNEVIEARKKLKEMAQRQAHINAEISIRQNYIISCENPQQLLGPQPGPVTLDLERISNKEYDRLQALSLPITVLKTEYDGEKSILRLHIQKPSSTCQFSAISTGSMSQSLPPRGSLFIAAIPASIGPNIGETAVLECKITNLWHTTSHFYVDVSCNNPYGQEHKIFHF